MKKIFFSLSLLVISLNASAERGSRPSLSPTQEVICFKEYVRPCQEKIGEFLSENTALEKENKELKAIIKNLKNSLQDLKKVTQEIRSDIN